ASLIPISLVISCAKQRPLTRSAEGKLSGSFPSPNLSVRNLTFGQGCRHNPVWQWHHSQCSKALSQIKWLRSRQRRTRYEEGRANPSILSSVTSLAHVNGAPHAQVCCAA